MYTVVSDYCILVLLASQILTHIFKHNTLYSTPPVTPLPHPPVTPLPHPHLPQPLLSLTTSHYSPSPSSHPSPSPSSHSSPSPFTVTPLSHHWSLLSLTTSHTSSSPSSHSSSHPTQPLLTLTTSHSSPSPSTNTPLPHHQSLLFPTLYNHAHIQTSDGPTLGWYLTQRGVAMGTPTYRNTPTHKGHA